MPPQIPCRIPYADQAVHNLFLFEFQLFFIGKGLELASSALPVIPAFGLHTKRRRHHHLLQPRIRIIFFRLYDSGLYDVPYNGILYKQRKTVCLANPLSISADILYLHSH